MLKRRPNDPQASSITPRASPTSARWPTAAATPRPRSPSSTPTRRWRATWLRSIPEPGLAAGGGRRRYQSRRRPLEPGSGRGGGPRLPGCARHQPPPVAGRRPNASGNGTRPKLRLAGGRRVGARPARRCARRPARRPRLRAAIAASPHDNDAAAALATVRPRWATSSSPKAPPARDAHLAGGGRADEPSGARRTRQRHLPGAGAEGAAAARSGAAAGWPAEGCADTAARAVDLCEAQVTPADARHDAALAWRGPRLGSARIVALKIAAAGAGTPSAQRQALQGASGEAKRLRALLAGPRRTARSL